MARSGSFADARIIDLLNRSAVPLFVDYDLYQFNGVQGWSGSARGTEELKRIQRGELARGFQYHNEFRPVHITVVSPDEEVLDVLDIVRLLNPEEVHKALTAATSKLQVKAGEPLFPAPDPGDLRRNQDDLVLRLVSRYDLEPSEVDRVLQALDAVSNPPSDWTRPPKSMLGNRVRAPGSDLQAVPKETWAALVHRPAPEVSRWRVDGQATLRLLSLLRPPSEVYRPDPARVEEAELDAEVVSEEGDLRHIRLTGSLVLRQPWWDLRDDERMSADLVGYLTWDRAADQVTSLELITLGARYRGGALRPSLDIPVTIAVSGPEPGS